MDTQLKKGLLEICVLAVLDREDSYGYKLTKDISTCIQVSESTLYPILRRLENGSCLSIYSIEHNGRLRKYYRITGEGKRRIKDFLDGWEDMMRIYYFIGGGINVLPEDARPQERNGQNDDKE